MSRRISSLRARLTVALLAVALAPLAVATAVLMQVNLTSLEQSAKEYRMATADNAIRMVLAALDQAAVELRAIGAVLGQTAVPAAERQELARARLLAGRHVHRAALFGADGAHVFTMKAADEHDTLQRPDRLPGALLETARGKGLSYLDVARTPRGRWQLPFLVSVLRGTEAGGKAELYGYLWSTIDLAPLADELERLSQRRFSRQSGRVFVVDHELRIIVHPDRARLGQSIAGRGIAQDVSGPGALSVEVAYSRAYTRRGEALLGVLVPLPALRWGVIVEQSRDEAYVAVRTTWRVALAVGIAFGLIAIGAGLLMGRRLARPISAVARAAKQVAGGDFAARVQVAGKDEVGEMARAFNQMAADLAGFREAIVRETRIRTDLSRYLGEELVEQIVKSKEELKLGGERRRITILFADVVAFTPLAEKHRPEYVVSILNELFTFLTEIVFKHGGTVDKFIGDCVMALFGAPYAHDDDPVRAVSAADEMLSWLEAGNAKWRRNLGRELQLGIGIHTGEVVVGNIGSQRRMEYTVIGDAVNVASRLEGLAQPNQVLMSQETAARVAGVFETTSLGMHDIIGRTERLEIFALVGD